MPLAHLGHTYTYVIGSDIDRDGMYVEVTSDADAVNSLLEIFYSDITHNMSITLHRPDLPLEVIEWAISIAKETIASEGATK